MSIFARKPNVSTKLRNKLLVSFCLMSLLPILIGVYIASFFIKFPFAMNTAHLLTISLVTIFSLTLSFSGYWVTRQLVSPILEVADYARQIARGEPAAPKMVKGSEEIEELAKSLKTISENARELLDKVEKLSMKDELTGLYNVHYIHERLNEEIQRAIHFQRPCSFAYFSIGLSDSEGSPLDAAVSEEVLKSIADIFRKRLGEFDRAARISVMEFAVIYPDKNKKKCIQLVEQIRGEILAAYGTLDKGRARVCVSIGISENPIDGVSAEELYKKAELRVESARASGHNGIEASN